MDSDSEGEEMADEDGWVTIRHESFHGAEEEIQRSSARQQLFANLEDPDPLHDSGVLAEPIEALPMLIEDAEKDNVPVERNKAVRKCMFSDHVSHPLSAKPT